MTMAVRGSTALQAIDIASIQSDGYSFQVEMNYRACMQGLRTLTPALHAGDKSTGS
jgi:dolichol-phosphate mannosyltransferase